MKRPPKTEQDNVLRFCFVALSAFSETALSPTQHKWARERAENCLWALGISEFKTERATYTAQRLENAKDTIDLRAVRLIAPAKQEG